jgi:hypothetical protein
MWAGAAGAYALSLSHFDQMLTLSLKCCRIKATSSATAHVPLWSSADEVVRVSIDIGVHDNILKAGKLSGGH